jgi:pantothenate synthetase
VDARTAALNGSNHSQQIKDQIVQTLTEAGGQVDYVEVMFYYASVLLLNNTTVHRSSISG